MPLAATLTTRLAAPTCCAINVTAVGVGGSLPGVVGKVGGAGGVPGGLPAGGEVPAVETSVLLATGGGVGVPPGKL